MARQVVKQRFDDGDFDAIIVPETRPEGDVVVDGSPIGILDS